MGRSNLMTEQKFRAIKILLNGGASIEEAATYMQVSVSTVRRCRENESWEEYLNSNYVRTNAYRAIAAKEAEKAAQQSAPVNLSAQAEPQTVEHIHHHEQSVTVIANHYMAEQLQSQTKLLTLISNKLAFIVDELTGTGTEKKEG